MATKITEEKLLQLQGLCDNLEKARQETLDEINIWHWVHRAVETAENRLNRESGYAMPKLLEYIRLLESGQNGPISPLAHNQLKA